MISTVLLCLLVVSGSVAPAPCQNAMDCELNGQCHGGLCACSPGWKGERCGELDLLPIASSKHMGFVPSDEAETLSCSWGGNIVREKDGQYSLVAAAMRGHCGIDAWAHNSEIVRAVASSPLGPYTFKETLVPIFAHEPNVIVAEDNQTLVMFYSACDFSAGCRMHRPVKSCSKPTRFPWAPAAASAVQDHRQDGAGRIASPRPDSSNGHYQTWMRYSL